MTSMSHTLGRLGFRSVYSEAFRASTFNFKQVATTQGLRWKWAEIRSLHYKRSHQVNAWLVLLSSWWRAVATHWLQFPRNSKVMWRLRRLKSYFMSWWPYFSVSFSMSCILFIKLNTAGSLNKMEEESARGGGRTQCQGATDRGGRHLER